MTVETDFDRLERLRALAKSRVSKLIAGENVTSHSDSQQPVKAVISAEERSALLASHDVFLNKGGIISAKHLSTVGRILYRQELPYSQEVCVRVICSRDPIVGRSSYSIIVDFERRRTDCNESIAELSISLTVGDAEILVSAIKNLILLNEDAYLLKTFSFEERDAKNIYLKFQDVAIFSPSVNNFIISCVGIDKFIKIDQISLIKLNELLQRSHVGVLNAIGIDSYWSLTIDKKIMLLESIKESIDLLIMKDIATLARKYRQNVFFDEYGVMVTDSFDREIDYYISHVIFSKINEDSLEIAGIRKTMLHEHIKSLTIRRNQLDSDNGVLTKYDPEMSGNDFEVLCCEMLTLIGWSARKTGRSGDQGTDIIAEKDNISISIQCKRCSSPVGNHAVQEAFSGKTYVEADYGLVVSDNTFTVSARQVALKTGIILIHFDQIENIDQILKEGSGVPSGKVGACRFEPA